MKLLKLVLILLLSFFAVNCQNPEKNNMKTDFESFVKKYEAAVIPVSREASLAYFNATISGNEDDYNKYADMEIQLDKIYSNKENFEELKRIKESGLITDFLQKRALDLLYLAYLGKQTDEKRNEEIIKMSSEIEKKFSTFRAEVNGRQLTDNQVEDILKTSTDSEELESAWKGHKNIGNIVAEDIIKLVKLRNESAKEIGFNNFHEMSLRLTEQDPEEIEKLFDELDKLTRVTFIKVKDEADKYLAERYNISVQQLMPWHYQNRYFQEAPKVYDVDLDAYYKEKDIAEITRLYYDGIGLNIDDLLEKSDLYEKEGKYQHAYCTTIDREGDVRVVCNITPNYNWMNTTLHEFGHAVYDKYTDENLPWELREPAHSFTTEAIAMLFGRFASNPAWLKDVLNISENEKEKIADEAFKSLRLEQLVFSRWVQVVYRFEKSMYDNPDQDLNKLWWDLVEKYQMIKKPEGRNEPDWASKIHIAIYPCYYHNYMLGELLASQLYYYTAKNIIKSPDLDNISYKNKKEVGDYLIKNIFKTGKKYTWNEMIERATGEELTPKYYAEQFVAD